MQHGTSILLPIYALFNPHHIILILKNITECGDFSGMVKIPESLKLCIVSDISTCKDIFKITPAYNPRKAKLQENNHGLLN